MASRSRKLRDKSHMMHLVTYRDNRDICDDMTSPQSDSQEQHQDDGDPDKSRQEQEEQDCGARQH